MKVLHVEMGRHLYGGARQVAYLLNGLVAWPEDRHLLVCAPGAAIAAAVDRSIEVIPLVFSGDADLGFVARLRRLIRREQPDLIHIHSRRGDLLTGLAGRLEKRIVIHSRRVDNPPRWLDRTLKFPLFDRIVTISGGIRQVLLEAGVPAAKLSCIPSAVDTELYRPQPQSLAAEFGLPDGAPVLAVVAQLIPRKGHQILFDALPAVLARHPTAQVLLFGQGPMEQALRQRVEAGGLQGNVHFQGFRTDLDRILPGLDLLVHPALMEGLGVSLLETAACGVPIVASRAGGMPEIVHDGINGYLVAPGDSQGLAAAILRLLDDPALRRKLGEAGRRLVLERFSILRMVEQNRQVYLDLARPAAARSGEPPSP